MKEFPPLHHLTASKLPPLELGHALASRAFFGAQVDPRLAHLFLMAGPQPDDEAESQEWQSAGLAFARASHAALTCFDASFFAQVAYCMEKTASGKLNTEGIDWLCAYAEVQANSTESIPQAPHASTVANAKNKHDMKTAIPAVAARDACRKLNLPLAPGARGKKRGGKSGKAAE